MKKILIVMAGLFLMATSCFAAITSTATGTMDFASIGLELHGDKDTADNTTALIGKASTGVSVGWATDVNGYALATQHQKGSKAYASSYDSTSLYNQDVDTIGEELLSPTATDTTDFAGWDRM